MPKQSENTITVKEIYTQLLELKASVRAMEEHDSVSRIRFYWISAVMIILEVLVLLTHLIER